MTLDFSLIDSPFARLRALVGDAPPGLPAIDMTIGEPRHGVPDLARSALAASFADFSKYPPASGEPALRRAVAAWLERRYPALAGAIDPDAHVLALNGSREGLFSALFTAIERKERARPAVMMPNPFYQAYLAAALAAGAEPVFLPATAATGHLPDLDAIPEAALSRAAAFYIASPANPQGSVAGRDYLDKAIALARAHGFMLFIDECYSEIYAAEPPPGGLESARAPGGGFANVAVFNSLSKRSSAPGLRSGFVAGDADFLAAYSRFRNVACPQTPLPLQRAAAQLWADEAHVEASRALYRRKFAAAEAALRGWPGFEIPAGGFFLWLDLSQLGGGERAAQTFWKEYGVKVLPGAYLAQTGSGGDNPGSPYARLALVDSPDVTAEALSRIARILS